LNDICNLVASDSSADVHGWQVTIVLGLLDESLIFLLGARIAGIFRCLLGHTVKAKPIFH